VSALTASSSEGIKPGKCPWNERHHSLRFFANHRAGRRGHIVIYQLLHEIFGGSCLWNPNTRQKIFSEKGSRCNCYALLPFVFTSNPYQPSKSVACHLPSLGLVKGTPYHYHCCALHPIILVLLVRTRASKLNDPCIIDLHLRVNQ
jgi:hypothetical protein